MSRGTMFTIVAKISFSDENSFWIFKGFWPTVVVQLQCTTYIQFMIVILQKPLSQDAGDLYNPFFTTWLCMLGTNFFLPLYLISKIFMAPKSHQLKAALTESIQGFRDKGFTLGKLMHFVFVRVLHTTTWNQIALYQNGDLLL